MKYDLIIFDCNGVILNDERMIKQVIVDELAARGHAMTLNYALQNLVGVSTADANRIIAENCGGFLPQKDFWETARARVRTAFDEAARDVSCHPYAMPDIDHLLDSLGDTRSCIVSNNTEGMLKHCLRQTGLWHPFRSSLYFPKDGKAGKPAPDLLWQAAEEFGVPPARCLVIEDGTVGVRAGVAAGMTVWGFAGGDHCYYDSSSYAANIKAYGKALRCAGASRVFCTMDDVEKALCQEEGRPAAVARKVGVAMPIL